MREICHDTEGATLVEFTVTLPLFLLLTFGIVTAGLLFWTQIGLQHGVEMAARCASVNYSANRIGLNTSCFTVGGTPVPPNNAIVDTNYIRKYAAENSYGLHLPYTVFAVTPPNGSNAICGANPGYLVTASYTFDLINYIFTKQLTATSCFPIF